MKSPKTRGDFQRQLLCYYKEGQSRQGFSEPVWTIFSLYSPHLKGPVISQKKVTWHHTFIPPGPVCRTFFVSTCLLSPHNQLCSFACLICKLINLHWALETTQLSKKHKPEPPSPVSAQWSCGSSQELHSEESVVL